MIIAIAATAFFFLFLIAERVLLRRARKRFALIIHVNGTRGKSTVTRMIHAMLRNYRGMEVYGKTTGSAARLLLPDGTEKPVLRFGPANIREQRNMLLGLAWIASDRQTRKKKALVIECNAIQEELQHISMKWLKPDITIITNVREDHTLELGKAEQAAEIFASAIPDNSVLVTPGKNFVNIWKEKAAQKKLKLIFTGSGEAGEGEFPENTGCVLGVAGHLEIDRRVALNAIAEHKPDAGAFAFYSWKAGSRSIIFADARAANDIESTCRLFDSVNQNMYSDPNTERILLLVNREDRPERTRDFLRYIIRLHKKGQFNQYLCLGHSPLAFRAALKREGVNWGKLRNAGDLDSALDEITGQTVFIFAVGNYGGPGIPVTRWLRKKSYYRADKQ